LLAKAGRRVILFEREKFPRFHIGESLLPFSMATFTRLGVHDKLLAAGFIEKFGGEMADAGGEKAVKFYFCDGFQARTDRSYQVTSSKLSPEEFFERAVAEQTVVADRIGSGRRVSEVYVAADFSYRMSSLAGGRWLLAGDAAGFIDPVFSSGVFLAVFAGERAADVL